MVLVLEPLLELALPGSASEELLCLALPNFVPSQAQGVETPPWPCTSLELLAHQLVVALEQHVWRLVLVLRSCWPAHDLLLVQLVVALQQVLELLGLAALEAHAPLA